MVDRHYTEPRLAAIYDQENAGRWDIDLYLALATELDAHSIIDLGCGTGVLASDLAAAGHEVIGVDPATAMLDIARVRPGGDRVRWIEGTSADLPSAASDLIVMSGHVAQVFVDDAEWSAVLADIHRALQPGGHLAFETRNAATRPWEGWTPERSFASFESPDGGEPFDSWLENVEVVAGVVTMTGCTRFRTSGDEIHTSSSLRFRTRGEIEQDLDLAGLEVVSIWGDWDRGPVTDDSGELIYVARRN
jgi:SAM-dependent methyltransferase